MLIKPHGGRLVNRVLNEKWRQKALERAGKIPRIIVRRDILVDLENIAKGVFSPLEGFMNEADFESVLSRKCLVSGLPWTIPICLDVTGKDAEGLELLRLLKPLLQSGALLLCPLALGDVGKEAHETLLPHERERVGGDVHIQD